MQLAQTYFLLTDTRLKFRLKLSPFEGVKLCTLFLLNSIILHYQTANSLKKINGYLIISLIANVSKMFFLINHVGRKSHLEKT